MPARAPHPRPRRACPPLSLSQVLLEVALSFALCLLGTVGLADGFKPIFSTDEAPLNSFHRLFGPRPDTVKF
jgi:hypothetical protein